MDLQKLDFFNNLTRNNVPSWYMSNHKLVATGMSLQIWSFLLFL